MKKSEFESVSRSVTCPGAVPVAGGNEAEVLQDVIGHVEDGDANGHEVVEAAPGKVDVEEETGVEDKIGPGLIEDDPWVQLAAKISHEPFRPLMLSFWVPVSSGTASLSSHFPPRLLRPPRCFFSLLW